MNHSRKFRSIVESMMPEYKNYVKWLKMHWNKLIF
jgi:predicted metal-dependent hydrolase